MRFTCSLIVSTLLAFGFTTLPAQASPAVAALDDAEPTFDQLQQKFQRLYRSLQQRGGLREQDREVVRELRDEFASFNDRNPEHEGGIASELQLSMWLQDHERVDSLFERLFEIAPENDRYGLSWMQYLGQVGMHERAEEIYPRLRDSAQDPTPLRITRAALLKHQSRYPQALMILEEAELDPNEHPEGVALKAELLYAENRFEESLAALDSIPEDALTGRTGLRGQIRTLRREARSANDLWQEELQKRSAEEAADDLPRVELVTSRGRIVLELFEDNAPNTVASFITLVEDGFYDNTRFHRVEPEFVAQGGDPNTRPDGEGAPGTGGPGYRIADEWQRDDARKHFAGTLAMANSGPDTAGSQFYITHRPVAHLNRGYTVFGRVLEGLDVARSIQIDDELESARVIRKREHDYEVEKLGETPEQPPLVE